MTAVAVYPGSFDPITRGHLDIAARAANLFDELHIVVVHNPAKNPRFSSEERVRLIEASMREAGFSKEQLARITVDTLDGGLLVNFCRMVGAKALVKLFTWLKVCQKVSQVIAFPISMCTRQRAMPFTTLASQSHPREKWLDSTVALAKSRCRFR